MPPEGNGDGGPTTSMSLEQLTSVWANLTQQYGNEKAAGVQLTKDNFRLRRRNARILSELDELKKKAVPEGSVVMTDADAKELEAFRKLELKPDQLVKLKGDFEELNGKLSAQSFEEQVKAAAESLGWKPSVLQRLLSSDGLELELREQDRVENGKTERVKVPHVRKKGDAKAPLEALSVYAERDWKELLSALPAEGSDHDSEATGVRIPAQGRSGRKDDQKSLIERQLGQYQTPSQRAAKGEKQ